MKHLAEYIESGKPIIGLRTATHAFNNSKSKDLREVRRGPTTTRNTRAVSAGRCSVRTWVAHHGGHGKQGTRGVVAKGEEANPILKGIESGSVFGTTDVYTAKPIGDSKVLLFGEVTETLKPDSKALAGEKNDSMMPVAWTKTYKTESGKSAKVFTTTMGSADDLSTRAPGGCSSTRATGRSGWRTRSPTSRRQTWSANTSRRRSGRSRTRIGSRGKTPEEMAK